MDVDWNGDSARPFRRCRGAEASLFRTVRIPVTEASRRGGKGWGADGRLWQDNSILPTLAGHAKGVLTVLFDWQGDGESD